MQLSTGAVSLQIHNRSPPSCAPSYSSGPASTWRPRPPRCACSYKPSGSWRTPADRAGIRERARYRTRPFDLATGATTLIHELGRPLRTLRKRFPQMSMHIKVAATEPMVDGLLNHQIDLALITLPFDAQSWMCGLSMKRNRWF